ncbi:mechanosensitive ion channel family protein [Pseudohalioglobus lutimaris]|uniref:Mechanosensing system component YbdG n=1 Tax=Pseudohalioglobus lutimaris TaxID=1737061 RepID=A0A2N5X7U5_9GAMM|nr:mechanosensitive ion channel domain-containing protein [Pseudohalioglobus lutimaris]PLW70566.1 miniconductance mechanosensitive channel [Pseudohalioglobus lutimaris]
MDNLRDEFKVFLLSWLDKYWPGDTQLEFNTLVVIWLAVFAGLLHFFLHGFVLRAGKRLAEKAGQKWQQSPDALKLFRRTSFVFQGIVLQIQAGLWLDDSQTLLLFIKTATDQWILLFTLLSFFSLLDFLQKLTYARSSKINFPLRGLLQTLKLIASIFVAILAVSILMGKSPLILLSGLGAISAVLMLVFKDPILGLVAGIQLSANEMLAIGDWLEMPKYGADGDVIDIGLTTVKVRNWDKTITTIPTYALISDSFKNWRGMTASGGRRIKRSVLIDTSSIQFLRDDDIERLKKADLLAGYLDDKIKSIDYANSKTLTDMSLSINGRRLTNIGTFRGYMVSYLKSHPDIHQKMTLIVRQLSPTSEGLPIEIYAFTNTTSWVAYEDIQSDIFDHIFAVLPAFGLRAHEGPTGHDIRALVER